MKRAARANRAALFWYAEQGRKTLGGKSSRAEIKGVNVSSALPEVIAKRKGVAARRGLKEAWSKNASQCRRTGSEA
jgi:hypothetical protein